MLQILSPLLPVALVTGQQVASRRLLSAGICCLNPKRIAIAGKARPPPHAAALSRPAHTQRALESQGTRPLRTLGGLLRALPDEPAPAA